MKTTFTFLLFVFFALCQKAMAQCTAGTIYAVAGSTQQALYTINPTTEATTLVVNNLFGGGAAGSAVAAGAQAQTSAVALDIAANTLWFCNRGTVTDPTPRIFSYNLTTNTYGTTSAVFSGVISISNINKAAYNPVDRRVYFHNSSTNTLYRFDPSTPAVAAVSVGQLAMSGVVSPGGFSGGDIAFDGLGNLTGAFNNANILAVFPAQYDAAGNYMGLSMTGQQFAPLSSAPSAVAFQTNGNYLVGSSAGTSSINTTTGAETDLGAVNFAASDFASCAAPAPNLVVTKTAALACSGSTSAITYTITIQNTGLFHAINTRLIDALPAGVTLNSATVNGITIATTNLATTGILIRSTNAGTDGQVLKGETATIVLNCSSPATGATYSNQAFVKYNGVETLRLPNNQVPSNDPGTVAANDATNITVCNSIAGTVFIDGDGQTAGVGGTPRSGVTVTLYASNGTTVLATTTTDASGNYSFNASQGNYIVGITAPSGFSNISSTDATPTNGLTNVTLATTAVTGTNFGIQRPPAASPRSQTINGPKGNTIPAGMVTQSVGGSDPEDGALGNANTIVITQLPANSTMFYNGIAVTVNQQITNFNPALLSYTGITPGSTSVVFNYGFIDAAGVQGSAASYSVNWTTPLPIKLQQFTTTLKNCNTVELNWIVSEAVNFNRFEIERSIDGVSYQTIATVAYQELQSSYVFENRGLTTGKYYYRLKLADMDNSYRYSDVLTVKINCADKELIAFPNPVQDWLVVRGLTGGEQIKLFSNTGQLLLVSKATGYQASLNVASCVPGIYLLTVTDGAGKKVLETKLLKPGR